MFVWRKRASAAWLAANDVALREIAGQRLAIISKLANKNAITEVASDSRRDLEGIRRRFGGVIHNLRRSWLRKFLGAQKSKPLKIGRLLIVSSGRSRNRSLVVPAGVAFGSGEHATTAMTLRLLERLTQFWGAQAARLPVFDGHRNFLEKYGPSASCRRFQPGSRRSPNKEFSALDLGTGSGILALAAARLGAKRVVAIDNDPTAIATAEKNARRNKIEQVDFRVADVRQSKFPANVDIVTANLFSELLIQILPKLKCARWLVLSGVLRQQEPQLVRALERNGFAVIETRRRGKWIAILAHHPERNAELTDTC